MNIRYNNTTGPNTYKQYSKGLRPVITLDLSKVSNVGGSGSLSDSYKMAVAYPITYDLKDGSVSTANPTSYSCYSNTITLNNPTKSGCKFLG
ncbi:MAG: hypothetical protein MJ246_00205 [Clostridia bacterium]|nr:hypothetical protein [Clostridia bacterium]